MKGRKDVELQAMRRRLEAQREIVTQADAQAGKWRRAAIKARRVAIVAVLACPGSFVAGGLLLEKLLVWWW